MANCNQDCNPADWSSLEGHRGCDIGQTPRLTKGKAFQAGHASWIPVTRSTQKRSSGAVRELEKV
ncbi:hypothetical protein GCM10027300_12650 [Modestobacter lapidis]